MNFNHIDLVEKVKPKIVSAIKNLFADDKKEIVSDIFAKKKATDSLIKSQKNSGDLFVKNKLEDQIYTPVSKKVWLNGKEYNVMAESQNELNQKIKNIHSKNRNINENIITIDPSQLCFVSHVVKKENKVEAKDWQTTRKVWFENYGIA